MPSLRHVSAAFALVLAIASCAAVPTVNVTVIAEGSTFSSETIRIPPGEAVRLTFENRDVGVPHGLDLQTRTSGVEPRRLWISEVQIGRSLGVYDIPALPAGPYQIVCRIHPGMLFIFDVG